MGGAGGAAGGHTSVEDVHMRYIESGLYGAAESNKVIKINK